MFYRGSVLANLLPVEEATKAGSLSTLPSLKRSTDRVSFLFSITWNTKFLQGPPQDWCLLPQLQVSLIAKTSPRERAQNKSQANKQVRHGDLFYRGSVLANLLPVEEATKAGSLSTLPSLKRSTDRVSFLFSITWNTKFLQGPPQDWCLLPQLQVSLIARKRT